MARESGVYMKSMKMVTWGMAGAFLGYFFLHPLITIVSHFMHLLYSSNENLISESAVAEMLKSFSISMLPWSLAFAIFSALVGLFYGKVKQTDEEKSKLIIELQEALDRVKTLSGFLPICASCKKIRDDTGYWNQVEVYIRDHSEAEFSHALCPECAKELYPSFYKHK
jgi:hypothetical protein